MQASIRERLTIARQTYFSSLTDSRRLIVAEKAIARDPRQAIDERFYARVAAAAEPVFGRSEALLKSAIVFVIGK